MRKGLSLLIIFLMFCAISPSVVVPEVCAQLKDDLGKNTTKMSLWFSKMKSKCEKAMEWVANSQVGQFVGDGIKYAKKGIAFAQEQYEAAMDMYNQTKDAVLNSKEYKAAMVSKDIAKETMVMKKILEEKKQKLEEIQQQEELIKQQAQAKIANIQSNLSLNEQRMVEENDASGDQAASFMSEQEKLLEEIEKETAEQIKSLSQAAEMIDEEYKDKEINQAEKIADLTLKLKDILDGGGKNKKETRSAKEVIQEQQDKLFRKANEKASLVVERKKKKNRAKAMNSSIDSGMQVAMGEAKQKQSSVTDKVDSKASVANTMTGESEVSGVNTEVIGEQLNIMINFIRLNLAYLKTHSIAELNTLHELETSPATNKFDLCEYTDPENRKSALEMLKSKATGAVSKVNNAVSAVKEKTNDLNSKIKEAKETFEEGAAVAGQLGDIAKETGGSLTGQIAPRMF